jgi:Na+/H+-dicarboxylate symporter
MKLERQILVGFIAGVVAGLVSRLAGLGALRAALIAIEPIGTVFIRLITMVVVPLVVASVFVGVASLGNARALGRVGGKTLLYFFGTTLLAATIGFGVARLANVGSGGAAGPAVAGTPVAGVDQAVGARAVAQSATQPSLEETLIELIPRNPLASAAGSGADLLPLIIAVCIFGAAATVTSGAGRDSVVAFFRGVNELSMVVIGWIMLLAPVGVFALIAALVARSGVALLDQLATYMLVVVVALLVHVAITLCAALRLGARIPIGTFLRSTSDALLLAFSTASSNATLPVTMAAAHDRLGVPDDVVGFVLPAGASLDKNGSAVYKAVTVVFITHLYGMSLGGGAAVTVILLSTMAAFAGAGVPGSSLVTTLIVLNGIGLGPRAAAAIALVAAVDRPLDMCRTTVNTFGNLVGAAWIARSEGQLGAPSA